MFIHIQVIIGLEINSDSLLRSMLVPYFLQYKFFNYTSKIRKIKLENVHNVKFIWCLRLFILDTEKLWVPKIKVLVEGKFIRHYTFQQIKYLTNNFDN